MIVKTAQELPARVVAVSDLQYGDYLDLWDFNGGKSEYGKVESVEHSTVYLTCGRQYTFPAPWVKVTIATVDPMDERWP